MRRWICVAVMAMVTGGCASSSGNPRDPFESVNRGVFKFNDVVDENVVKPIAKGYNWLLPQLVRDGVSNFFSNLGDVWIGVNNLLQGKVYDGTSDFMRVVINTVFGLGGLIDVASSAQLPKHNEDFGQTLGRWGLGSGPYLVLPIFGPSDLRDGAGLIADLAASPLTPVVSNTFPQHWAAWRNGLMGLYFINTRANLLTATDLVDVAATDRYAFIRDAYLQRRRSLIYDGEPPPEKEEDEGGLPPYRRDADRIAWGDERASDPAQSLRPVQVGLNLAVIPLPPSDIVQDSSHDNDQTAD